jgi:hypothetical protein
MVYSNPEFFKQMGVKFIPVLQRFIRPPDVNDIANLVSMLIDFNRAGVEMPDDDFLPDTEPRPNGRRDSSGQSSDRFV